MLQTKRGWNNPFVSDEIMRGYFAEMQSFVERVIYNKKDEFDFQLARETIKALYEAYAY